MYQITEVVEARSLIEMLFFLKEELLKGTKFLGGDRTQYNYPSDLESLLDHQHYYWVTENGKAYSIMIKNYFDDIFYNDIALLNIEKYYQFIINNSEKIDKYYKMKAFI